MRVSTSQPHRMTDKVTIFCFIAILRGKRGFGNTIDTTLNTKAGVKNRTFIFNFELAVWAFCNSISSTFLYVLELMSISMAPRPSSITLGAFLTTSFSGHAGIVYEQRCDHSAL